MRIQKYVTALAMSLALIMSAGAAAQDSAARVSDNELQMFVDVQQDIMSITQEYSGRLNETDDEERQKELQREASQLMVKAVDDIGLGVDGYNKVGQALQSDEELQARAQEMLQQ